MNSHIKKLLFLVLVFSLMSAGIVDAAVRVKVNAESQDLKRMSVFLSNFTELGMTDIPDVSKLSAGKLVYFGLWHNYINNYDSIKSTNDARVSLDAKFVIESIKKYFAIDIKKSDLKTVTYFQQNFLYDGKKYIFEASNLDTAIYADVKEVYRSGEKIIMKGEIYRDDEVKDVLGKFTAYAKPWKYGGKETWALLSIKAEN